MSLAVTNDVELHNFFIIPPPLQVYPCPTAPTTITVARRLVATKLLLHDAKELMDLQGAAHSVRRALRFAQSFCVDKRSEQIALNNFHLIMVLIFIQHSRRRRYESE